MRFAILFTLLVSQALAGTTIAHATPPSSTNGMPARLDAESSAAVEGINSFSLDLYRQSIPEGENLFLSPASVSIAVGLAYRGARGATADELRAALHYGADPQTYIRAAEPVLTSMNFSAKGAELNTANALWLQNDLPVLPDFLADMSRYAQSGIERIDFRSDPEAARKNINSWVATATRDRIKEILQKGVVKADTRAALVNAIYFKGDWLKPFSAAATKTEPFSALDGTITPTPLMHQRHDFRVIEHQGVKLIDLPYASHISMIVLLPNSAKALPRFESGLTHAKLIRLLADLEAAEHRDTILTLPKMHLEWGEDLVGALQALGVKAAFSDADADFSGMAAAPFPGDPQAQGLKISKVIHQANLDVDEKGTEAAAATVVLMGMIVTGRRGPPPPPPFIFRADKPFMFLLKDRRTGTILFMGRYVTPDTK